jgi:hypothetical protein
MKVFGASVQAVATQLAPETHLQGPSVAVNLGQVIAVPANAVQAYGATQLPVANPL